MNDEVESVMSLQKSTQESTPILEYDNHTRQSKLLIEPNMIKSIDMANSS